MSDVASEAQSERDKLRNKAGGAKASPTRSSARPSGGARIYKPGQGFYTRIGTAIGIGILAVGGAAWLFSLTGQMMDRGASYFLPVQYSVSVGFLLIVGLLTYWIVGLNSKANDFFIATEGEMKKVNWSTRREIIKSTQVVIITVILLATLLFVVDLIFMSVFYAIGVIKVPLPIVATLWSFLKNLFGMG